MTQNPFQGLFGMTVPGTDIPAQDALDFGRWLYGNIAGGNGQYEPPGGVLGDDVDQDGIPDWLEGGFDCDQLREAKENIKKSEDYLKQCLGIKRRRRRRKPMTKGDMDAISFLKSQGFSKSDIIAYMAARPG